MFSVTTSLTITLLSGFAIAEAHFWHPLGVFVVLAGAAAVLHGTALVRTRGMATDRRRSLAEVRERVRGAAPALVASVVGLVLVVGSCLTHHGSYAGFAGMFSRIGPWWYAGIVFLVVGVVAAGAAGARWVAGFCVVVFVTALALTPALLYDYPTVTSAARHVGVAQVIRQIGGVDPAQGIYHRWPALFAGSATIWDVGDVTNPLSWARWWPVLVNPVAALGVRALAERILVATRIGPVSPYRLWLGAAVFAVANVLGNAYFSPQSTCFVLALVVLVLAVPTTSSATGRGKALRLTGLTVVALAITVTHQLTPYLILPALFVLIVFRLIRPWYVLLLVGVPAVGWALANFSILSQFINLGALGKATANAAPPSHGGDLGYRGLTDFAIYSPMTLFLVIGAAATFIALRYRGRLRWALLACAASPAALFAGNNYGNEALFRAALFSLPWIVTLLVSGRWQLRARLPVFGAALLVGAAVFALGTDGLDWYRVIRPGTVQAVQKFELDAPAKSVVLMTGSGNAVPGRLTARSSRDLYVARDTLHVLPKSVHYNGANDVYSMTRALTRRRQTVGVLRPRDDVDRCLRRPVRNPALPGLPRDAPGDADQPLLEAGVPQRVGDAVPARRAGVPGRHTSGGRPMSESVAYLILAHADAEHVRRLVAAVHPAPVVLHCDRRTDDAVYDGDARGSGHGHPGPSASHAVGELGRRGGRARRPPGGPDGDRVRPRRDPAGQRLSAAEQRRHRTCAR